MKSNFSLHGHTRVILLIIPYFFVLSIFQFIGLLFAKVKDKVINVDELTTQQLLIISFFSCLGTFLLLSFFMKYVDKEHFTLLGFQSKNRGKDILIGVFIGFVVVLISYFLLIKLNQITHLRYVFNFQEVCFSILVYITVSFSEEVLFRGYILKNLLISIYSPLALVLSALLFSLMHSFNSNIDWFSFLSLFLGGILLGVSYVYTRNLWFPIALHFSWNLFQTLFGFNVSGHDFYSFIEFEVKKNNIFNGGNFGFEGSIFSIIFQLILIACIVVYYERKKNIIIT
ncbi:CPBP family intramembrane glutamic endopeptidase [Tenacibaculum ovolyticum]|uniref:CPBP family intramembrane glutamic endopeptidase n=1 Tax=Tenacibaculum ovolyticum TaxID=104270 RepID=UPI0007ED3349|nr:type II CAAX endopeptidase family protein [Tenacibaculum ovolyticum]